MEARGRVGDDVRRHDQAVQSGHLGAGRDLHQGPHRGRQETLRVRVSPSCVPPDFDSMLCKPAETPSRSRSCSRSSRTSATASTWTSRYSHADSDPSLHRPRLSHRFDYIARDSNAIGERGNLSLSRSVQTRARVCSTQLTPLQAHRLVQGRRQRDLLRHQGCQPGLRALLHESMWPPTSTRARRADARWNSSASTSASTTTRPARIRVSLE